MSGRPSSTPARNHSPSWLRNLVSSYAALARPVFSSSSETAKRLFPSLSRSDTCMWLNDGKGSQSVNYMQRTEIGYPLHPGSWGIAEHRKAHADRRWTHVAPGLGHKTRCDPMLHAYALGEIFEQDGIICHAVRRRVRQCSFIYAGAGLSICADLCSEITSRLRRCSSRCPSSGTSNLNASSNMSWK